MFTPFQTSRAKLKELAEDTCDRIPVIIAETTPVGSSYKSTCYHQSTPLLPCESKSKPKITVQNIDTFSVGRALLGPSGFENHGHVACINMANAEKPAGTWLTGSMGQEEMLCSRSTLYATLNPQHYPLTGVSCIWSPDVVIFRHELHLVDYTMPEFEDFDQRFLLGVISVPALFRPEISATQESFVNSEDQELLENKIRTALRVLAKHNQTHIVLGALGCGAFMNPPMLIARTFKMILAEREWEGHFKEIVFAVKDNARGPNIVAFREVFRHNEK